MPTGRAVAERRWMALQIRNHHGTVELPVIDLSILAFRLSRASRLCFSARASPGAGRFVMATPMKKPRHPLGDDGATGGAGGLGGWKSPRKIN
jgi:hypothetical protein